ncbi:hypothetical protein SAMN06265365_101218 [Tistlia consotensis]|uniref:DUF5667 domain-containing protein n=1 Tax=Tistlia consotensis USBA 355 TaxID=560819 RepID=A0A1Y6B884_9PROT|nr:hypothetical protein [Tistlia consotensis]SME89483.1 hypothetical protein SAMN05428998_101216 [Tistlia consotensis USBA 355]SNR26016.1 hypothetical protein SAMN06265365_101218 [Tistlia consotensis]
MNDRPKLWTALGVALLAGTALSQPGHAFGKAAGPGALQLADSSEGGEGGEGAPAPAVQGGEGGEGAAEPADLARDDVAYLLRLERLRGHLMAGMALYRKGEPRAAEVHLEHHAAALHEDLEEAFEARGVAAFEDRIEVLAKAVEDGAPADRVAADEAALQQALAAAEAAVAGLPLGERMEVVEELVRSAGRDYGSAVKDGRIVDVTEYQDAYGFLQSAQRLVEAARPAASGKAATALQQIQQQLDLARPALAEVLPPERTETDASVLWGAAARIEIARLGLK